MKVGIIGVGLIGGSIARALARHAIPLWMDDADAPTRRAIEALGLGTIGPWTDWIREVDAVAIAVPLPRVPEVVSQVVPMMRQDAALVELSSLKVPLLPSLLDAARRVRVLSLHLMAGREVSGFGSASPDLFHAAPAIAVDLNVPLDASALNWWRESLGTADFVVWDAVRHDAAMAWISQLPYLVSRALTVVTEREASGALAAAGPGFRDTARVGRSDLSAVLPMLRTNHAEVSRALLAFESTLRGWRERLNRPGEEDWND